MSRRRRPFAVYWIGDAPADVAGIVRYDGDPDVFTALATDWLRTERDGYYDEPVAICPPEPRLWRWNPNPGWAEYPLTLTEETVRRPGTWLGSLIKTRRIGCPQCDRLDWQPHAAGCLNEGIDGLVTLQFLGNRREHGLFCSPQIIHVVRRRAARPGRQPDTPGPTLCDIDRFGPYAPSWTVGGAVTVDGMKACYLCRRRARDMFPGLPVHGTLSSAYVFAGDGIPLAANLTAELAAKATNRTALQEAGL